MADTQPPSRRQRRPIATGSEKHSESSEPEFLLVGRITKPHGIKGEVLMQVFTDYPERLSQMKTVYLRGEFESDPHQPYDLKKVRDHNRGLLLTFDGIDDRDLAEALRELRVYVHIDDAVPLEDGEYYIFQLEGLTVVTDEGQTLGTLVDVMETGANDVYVIRGEDGKDVLIPAIPDVIKKVDVEAGVMTIHLLEGLI